MSLALLGLRIFLESVLRLVPNLSVIPWRLLVILLRPSEQCFVQFFRGWMRSGNGYPLIVRIQALRMSSCAGFYSADSGRHSCLCFHSRFEYRDRLWLAPTGNSFINVSSELAASLKIGQSDSENPMKHWYSLAATRAPL